MYLIMDLAEKGSLASVINTKSSGGQDLLLDWPTKMRLAYEIALGLEYIHGEGVLHRDLKSANVLLTRHMEVKLADFGLAEVRQSMSTGASISNSSTGVVGTLRWMAPELFSDKPKYSPKSDMYALGMVMWEMAANCTRPFQDQTNDYVVPTFVKDGRREVLPYDTPAQYRELVEQCWHQDPAYRPDASKAALMVHDEPTEEGGVANKNCSATSFGLSTNGSILGQRRGCDEVESALYNLKIAENQQSGHVGRLPQTDDPVVSFFCMQARQGNQDAQLFLGWMYSHGWGGVEKSVEDSLCWYREAAERGNDTAQLTLARIYEQGQGVEPSDVEAVTWYRKAADRGNAEAQFSLGQLYDYGRGVKESLVDAAQWYGRAADQGHVDAQVKMGSWCSLGLGVEKSDIKAVNWYRKAALQGSATGQLNFGYMYHSGQGLERDDIKAVEWYRKAADQGEAGALVNLGVMYYHGYGVGQSYIQAVALYRRAAEQGHLKAQCCLSSMYQDGLGVEQDYVEAASWLRKAAEQGYHQAQHELALMYLDAER
jgi:TPR repeat protein